MIAFCVHLTFKSLALLSEGETSRPTDRLSPESQVELVPPAQTADPVIPSPSYISQSTSDISKRSLDQSFPATDVRHGSWSIMNGSDPTPGLTGGAGMAGSPLCTYLKLFLAGSEILPESKSARNTPSWLATCNDQCQRLITVSPSSRRLT